MIRGAVILAFGILLGAALVFTVASAFGGAPKDRRDGGARQYRIRFGDWRERERVDSV